MTIEGVIVDVLTLCNMPFLAECKYQCTIKKAFCIAARKLPDQGLQRNKCNFIIVNFVFFERGSGIKEATQRLSFCFLKKQPIRSLV